MSSSAFAPAFYASAWEIQWSSLTFFSPISAITGTETPTVVLQTHKRLFICVVMIIVETPTVATLMKWAIICVLITTMEAPTVVLFA